jgi:hypothetical protein
MFSVATHEVVVVVECRTTANDFTNRDENIYIYKAAPTNRASQIIPESYAVLPRR